MERRKIMRLAGMGALGAAGGIVAFFALLVWITRPVPTGGMNTSQAVVTWISLGGVIVALVAVHVVYAILLLGAARLSSARD